MTNDSLNDNTQALADSVKRLREIGKPLEGSVILSNVFRTTAKKQLPDFYSAYPEAMQTINALVELVGDLIYELNSVKRLIEYGDGDVILAGSARHKNISEIVTKAQPIEALAKGEK